MSRRRWTGVFVPVLVHAHLCASARGRVCARARGPSRPCARSGVAPGSPQAPPPPPAARLRRPRPLAPKESAAASSARACACDRLRHACVVRARTPPCTRMRARPRRVRVARGCARARTHARTAQGRAPLPFHTRSRAHTHSLAHTRARARRQLGPKDVGELRRRPLHAEMRAVLLAAHRKASHQNIPE